MATRWSLARSCTARECYRHVDIVFGSNGDEYADIIASFTNSCRASWPLYAEILAPSQALVTDIAFYRLPCRAGRRRRAYFIRFQAAYYRLHDDIPSSCRTIGRRAFSSAANILSERAIQWQLPNAIDGRNWYTHIPP